MHLATTTKGKNTMARKEMTKEEATFALTQLDADEVEAALSEVEREMHVRERCYGRWVEEGKLSRIDAKDRMDRQILAYKTLTLVLDSLTGRGVA
jgi:hypothetical protein